MEKLHGRTLEYWKNNAEEDYLKVPISVLRYITCLEERIEQLTLTDVSHRRELLKAWEIYKDESHYNRFEVVIESDMDDFLKSL